MRVRDLRQDAVFAWVCRCFGKGVSTDSRERVARLLEEAIELAQAEGFPRALAAALLDHVYARPAGDPAQEVGGVGITLLAYCAARGFSAENCEANEFDRIMSLPADHFRARQNAKADAGVARRSDGDGHA